MSLVKKPRIICKERLDSVLEQYNDFRELASQSQWCDGRLNVKIPTSLFQQAVEKFILNNIYVIPDIYYNFIQSLCNKHNLQFLVLVQDVVEVDEDILYPNLYTVKLPFEKFYTKTGFKEPYIHIDTAPYKSHSVSGPLTRSQHHVHSFLNKKRTTFTYTSDDDDD